MKAYCDWIYSYPTYIPSGKCHYVVRSFEGSREGTAYLRSWRPAGAVGGYCLSPVRQTRPPWLPHLCYIWPFRNHTGGCLSLPLALNVRPAGPATSSPRVCLGCPVGIGVCMFRVAFQIGTSTSFPIFYLFGNCSLARHPFITVSTLVASPSTECLTVSGLRPSRRLPELIQCEQGTWMSSYRVFSIT